MLENNPAVGDAPSDNTEYRFTGLLRPVGPDHALQDRHGAPCDVVGYDLDLDRDAPLAFRIRFADGLETYVLPEEVDEPLDPACPLDPRLAADAPPGGRDEQAGYLREKILTARVEHYRSLLWGDRFDGSPNFDTRDGEERALCAFAREFGFEVPDPETTREEALSRMEQLHPESEDVREFVEALRAGLEWDYNT